MDQSSPKFYRIHHFAWLDYPAAADWTERYHVARQIRNDAVPHAITLVRSAGGVHVFGDDAQRLAEILDLKTDEFNGQPLLILERDATFRKPATNPVQLALFSLFLAENETPGEQALSTLSLRDAFGSEPASKEKHITEITDVPLLYDPRLNAQAFVWYSEIMPLSISPQL